MTISDMIRTLGLLSLSIGCYAQSFVPPFGDLYITNEFIAPDGFNRSATVVDRQYPAPLIKANKGDRFQLNVHNLLTDNTMERALTVHWHGLFQHKTNWDDGVAFVTQCPVIPGNSFSYNFTPAAQTGTYWYHSHFSLQYCDGLRGPLVIYDPDDPFKRMYDVDDETTVLTISDWQHLTTLSPEFPQFPLSIDSILFNGKGRYIGGPQTDLSVVTVTRGKRYRMRLVSISCDPNFYVWIDGHDMTVIEADGVNHKPVTVGSLQIFAGQRYSFILNANQPVGNYWIWAQTGPSVPGIVNVTTGINVGILRYVGAGESEPTANESTFTNLLKASQLHPLVDPAAPGKPWPGGADVNINLPIEVMLSNLTPPKGNWTLNHTTYQAPSVPVLLQILNGVPAQRLLPAESIYSLPPNKVIEMSFPNINTPGTPHPLHLHGHTFSVVRSAGSKEYNYKNPPRRDVVSVGNSTLDNVTIRFVTDNPGPWFLHCHIDYHLNSGFAVVMAEDVPDVANLPVPLEWQELCPAYANFSSSEPCFGATCAQFEAPPAQVTLAA